MCIRDRYIRRHPPPGCINNSWRLMDAIRQPGVCVFPQPTGQFPSSAWTQPAISQPEVRARLTSLRTSHFIHSDKWCQLQKLHTKEDKSREVSGQLAPPLIAFYRKRLQSSTGSLFHLVCLELHNLIPSQSNGWLLCTETATCLAFIII